MSDTGNRQSVEFVLAGLAGCGAGIVTNPLEVVKTRMQLQGELKMRGQHTVHYRNVVHAFYTVCKNDGLLAVQKGLVPALWYQFFMNGARLGSYQIFANWGFLSDSNGNMSYPRTVVFGATSGCIGAFIGSPFYMIKTHLQAQSTEVIAVGYQHVHRGMTHGLSDIFHQFGLTGLWRGVSAAIMRVSVGSAIQLSTFSNTKQWIEKLEIFPRSNVLNAFSASMISGVAVTAAMTPFDVVATRMYNQGVSSSGRGLLYSSLSNCFVKILREEGLWGFYKGWGPSYIRLAPHTTLSLVLWNQLSEVYRGAYSVIPGR